MHDRDKNSAWDKPVTLRRMRALLVMVCLSGCTKPNPAFCEIDEDCNNGFRCDDTHSCVEVVIEPEECQADPDCTDTAKPICENNVCRGCSADSECTSQICLPDGSCEDLERVIYVGPGAAPTGDCLLDSPCELLFAKSKLSTSRPTIRLESGTYALVNDFVVDAIRATIVGNPDSVLEDAGASFKVANGGTLTLRGFSIERGVACMGATLNMAKLKFDHATPGVPKPWVAGTNCAMTLEDSDLIDSTQHGVSATGGSLSVANTRVLGSQGNGVLCNNASCSITTSVIRESQLIGIDATPLSLQLSRSDLTENHQGGVRSLGGVCDVTNNFVFRNGNDKDGTFGGMRLEPAAGANRVQHNTIVFNDCDPFASPAFAGGLFCNNSVAPNNIIFNNAAGNNTMPNAQTGGGCNYTGSLIRNGDGTNEIHFVSPVTAPFDYHLADNLGPASNTGMPGTVTEDFDGESRSNPPDIGADEVP